MITPVVDGIVIKDASYEGTSKTNEMDRSVWQLDNMHIRWFLCFENFPLQR